MQHILKISLVLYLFSLLLGCGHRNAVSSKKITPLPTWLRTEEPKSGIDTFLSLTKSKRSDYKYLLEVSPAELSEETNGVYKYSDDYFEELETGKPVDWGHGGIPGWRKASEKKRIEKITKNFNPNTDAIIVYHKTTPTSTTTTIGWHVINRVENKTTFSSVQAIAKCFFPPFENVDIISLSPPPPPKR